MEKQTQANKQNAFSFKLFSSKRTASCRLQESAESTDGSRKDSLSNEQFYPLYLIYNKLKCITKINTNDILQFFARSSIITTYLSIPPIDKLHDHTPEGILTLRVQRAIHNTYNQNVGIIMVMVNNRLSHLCQFILVSNAIFLLPKHAFDSIAGSEGNGSLLFVLASNAFKISKKHLCESSIEMPEFIEDEKLNYDFKLVKLPFKIPNISTINFNGESDTKGKGYFVLTKHLIKEGETYVARTHRYSLDLLAPIRGTTEMVVNSNVNKYSYTHTHLPSTFLGMSGGLILDQNNVPFGVITAANGCVSCQMLSKLIHSDEL